MVSFLACSPRILLAKKRGFGNRGHCFQDWVLMTGLWFKGSLITGPGLGV